MRQALEGPVFISIAIVVATAVISLAGEPHGKRQRLFWPKLPLLRDAGERIEAVDVLMSCGRFRGLLNIPNDWSLEVVSPSSEQTRLRLSAGHGATMLWGLGDLDGVVNIEIADPSCFDISAQVTSNISGESKKYKFSRAELRLSP